MINPPSEAEVTITVHYAVQQKFNTVDPRSRGEHTVKIRLHAHFVILPNAEQASVKTSVCSAAVNYSTCMNFI